MNERPRYRKRFVYTDIHSNAVRQWKRALLSEVDEKLIQPSRNFRCFTSVQLWEKWERDEREEMWMPLFFDLDSEGDLDAAIADVKKIIVYMEEMLQVPADYVRVYFSGSKGFHVIVQPEVFDIRPAADLHLKVKKAALYVAELLKLATFDHRVYSKRRMLRVYNSVHEKTKLYKIELSHRELNRGADWIKETARRPQRSSERPHEDDFHDDVGAIEEAKEFWDRVTREMEEVRELGNLTPDHTIVHEGGFPVCVQFVLQLEAQPSAHAGNRTVLCLASYMRDAGKDVNEALAIIVPWARKQKNIGDAGNPDAAEAMAVATTRYVFETDEKDPTYHFSCKYILSLGTAETKIPCKGLACPAIRGQMQKTKEVIELPLCDFSKSIYLRENVQVPCLIAGKAGTPYVVPKTIRFSCEPDEKKGFCVGCPLTSFNGNAEFEFASDDPEILEIVNCSRETQWRAIKKKFRFPPNCRRVRTKVLEHMNIEEVRMSPATVNIADFEDGQYVVRKGYFVGYPLQSNKRFSLKGVPVTEPATQASAFLFQQAEKLETEIETFELSDDVKEKLKVFQPAEGQGVSEKFQEIHDDLSANVYRLTGRDEMAMAVDLVAHSVRGFRFQKEPFVKGWVELIIVGDSGQGKSACVLRLLKDHYRIGEMISGGTARRTGLLYSYQETGKQWMLIWGIIPLSDGGLVIIDEFSDLPEEEFARLTDVRSSGIVRATGVINAETFGRVRLVALTNPRKGKPMMEFDYPCIALKQVIPASEDIRRFDLALGVASGEVPIEDINAETADDVEHVYTSHLCAMLIRWAWSRTERQVVFSGDTVKMILAEAIRLSREFHSGEIPLVEPADMRFKIARLSIATAARLFSTDESCEKVIVKPDHVLFAVTLLMHLYTRQNFRYHEWSRQQRKVETVDVSDVEKTFAKFKQLSKWKTLAAILSMSGQQVEARDLEAIYEDRTKATAVSTMLRHLGILEKRFSRMKKTAHGAAILKWMVKEKKLTQEEIDAQMLGIASPDGAPPPQTDMFGGKD